MRSLKLPMFLGMTGLILLFVGTAYLNTLYSKTRPTSPDPARGFVYEHTGFRGSAHVFISRGENWLYLGTLSGGVLLVLAGSVLWERVIRRDAA
jgi:hypothetical protein